MNELIRHIDELIRHMEHRVLQIVVSLYGYYLIQAQDLVKKFNSAENNDEISIVKNRIKSLLSCQCRNTTDNCVTQCFSGKYVGIHRTCWAGRKGTSDNSTASYRRPTMVRYTVNDFFERDGGDPVGKFEQEGDPFAAAVCSKESCSLHNGSRTWILGEEDPCHKGFHLVGPLCTVCARNYTVSMGTLVSGSMLSTTSIHLIRSSAHCFTIQRHLEEPNKDTCITLKSITSYSYGYFRHYEGVKSTS